MNSIHAPSHWRVLDFISDLHLQEQQVPTFEQWRDYMASAPADAIFILGDLFEVWVGDDAIQASEAHSFESKCHEVLRQAASSRPVHFMRGNRDFLVGAQFLRSCGVVDLEDPTILTWHDQRYMLSHGDALCLDDTDYQAFRAQVRSPAWQQAFLRRPLAERRIVARQLRDKSEARKHERPISVDLDDIAVRDALRRAGANTLIHGHTHKPGGQAVGEGYRREVLSDWDCATQPIRAEVLRLTPRGFSRLSPLQAMAF